MTKHTPGPWECEEASECWHDDHVWAKGGRGKGEHITTVCSGTDNARLIAAAPELLEALERVIYITEVEDAHLACFGEFESARAIIAKAKGEPT